MAREEGRPAAKTFPASPTRTISTGPGARAGTSKGRVVIELRDTLAAFMAEPHIGILATLYADGTPHLAAVWYVYEGGVVKVSVAEGRPEVEHARRDPRVALAVAGTELPYKQVTLEGLAEIEENGGADFFSRLAKLYHGTEKGARYAEQDALEPERRVILHFRPTRAIARDSAFEDDYHRAWGEGYDMRF